MRRKKKFSLTLLEVVIAMGITGLLLSTLWGIYRNWYNSYGQMQKSQVKLYRVLFAKHKIEHLCFSLARFPSNNTLFTPEKTDTPSVFFSYKPKVDIDPAFRDTISSLLYVDSKAKTLCLTSWGEEGKVRQEVLVDQVTGCTFSFFDRQTSNWMAYWPEEIDHLPLWMKVELQTQEEKETLLFRISYPEEPILYFDMLQERQ